MAKGTGFTVAQHFVGRAESVRATYDAIVSVARSLGPLGEDPKKTSIHLTRRTAFAGVATRKASVILTLKSETNIPSQRIRRRERPSANRWHLEVELLDPKDVDREVRTWLRRAYDLAD
jgi:hypothetical protein